jgi:hypothetical protein
MHPIQDLFLEGFSYVLQIDMPFLCTPMWRKFYSCKKWVLHKDHAKLCDLLSLDCEPKPWLDGPDESTRFTPLSSLLILHSTCYNNTQQEVPITLGVSISVSRTGGRKQKVV